MQNPTVNESKPDERAGCAVAPGSAAFPSRWWVLKNKILWYKNASDEDVLRCVRDKPLCGYAVMHQAIDMPFALREARRRGILPNPKPTGAQRPA